MDNYEFCCQWVLDKEHGDGCRVLDYGCGSGQIVEKLRERNIEAFGCDVFYEGAGGEYSESVRPELMECVIRRMEKSIIPFDRNYFDFVINNQVMEHVEDLDSALSEIHRVLKPKGIVLSLFPDNGIWREGHCGIPFVHWFPKGSGGIRLYYAGALRLVGLGYHKGSKGIMRWSKEFCDWLDMWTYYRSLTEIRSTYDKYFVETRHIEDNWLRQRFSTRYAFVNLLPANVQRLIVRKLAGLVLTSYKAGDERA